MIMQFFIAFAVAAAAALAMTPLVIRLAHHVRAVDQPNERKIHTHPIPRLGGAAVCAAFLLTATFIFVTRSDMVRPPWGDPLQGAALVITCLLVLALGIWDDIKQLGPGKKFLFQVLLSSIVYIAGVRISIVSQPLGGGLLDLGWLGYPATVLWIVGIMNALNLIDGLDGLASGVAMVAAITIAAISFAKFEDAGTAMVAVILAGALLGFLRYNFNPAKIFLGDSGSLFLGFVLAVLSIRGSTKGSTAFALLIPALSLGLPILDTILSMVRRLLRPIIRMEGKGESTLRRLRSMFLPDRDHIHHRLLALGLSQRQAVVLLYFVASGLGCSAYGLTLVNHVGGVLIIAVAGVAIMAGVHRLRYREFAILRSGSLLPIYRHPFTQSPWFQGAIDTGFTIAAFLLAYTFGRDSALPDPGVEDFRLMLLGVTALQMSVFFFSGVYKGVLRHAGVEDAVRIMKSVAISLFIGAGLYLLLGLRVSDSLTRMFLLDFYFLMTLLVVSRFSFALLNRLAREKFEGKDPVVIYGTGDLAIAALRTILASPGLRLRPVGFLEDNPRMEGRTIHGYPVLGGHWRLERLLRSQTVSALIVASNDILPEVQKRIRQITRQERLPVRIFAPFSDLSVEMNSRSALVPAPVQPSVLAEQGRADVLLEKFLKIT